MGVLRAWMGSDLDVIMVGTWMLCGHGWESDLDVIMVGTWVFCGHDLDVIMVGTWMLCGHGWGLIWKLSWVAHGCSAGVDAAHPDGLGVRRNAWFEG